MNNNILNSIKIKVINQLKRIFFRNTVKNEIVPDPNNHIYSCPICNTVMRFGIGFDSDNTIQYAICCYCMKNIKPENVKTVKKLSQK